jgi:hypothetical protein
MSGDYRSRFGRLATAKRRAKIPALHAAGKLTREITCIVFDTAAPTECEMQKVRNDLATLGLRANRPDKPIGRELERPAEAPVRRAELPPLAPSDQGPQWAAVDDMGFQRCAACYGHGHVPPDGICRACLGKGWRRAPWLPKSPKRIPATAFAGTSCALGSVE